MPIFLECVFDSRREVSTEEGVDDPALAVKISAIAHQDVAAAARSAIALCAFGFAAFCLRFHFFVHRLHPIRIAANGNCQLVLRNEERFSNCRIKMTKNMEDLEQHVLPRRAEMDLVGITGGGPGIRFFDGLIDDRANDRDSFFGWELVPKVTEEFYEAVTMPEEMFAPMMGTARNTLTPQLNCMAKKRLPTSSILRVLRIKPVKYASDRDE